MLNINSVSDLLQLSMFKDSESTPCQVYNPAGECCFCGFFDEVVQSEKPKEKRKSGNNRELLF